MTKTKAELQAALDTLQGKYDELANAIRNGVPYTQMTRMVGASEEENAQAKARIESLDVLEPQCNWSAIVPNTSERSARQRWDWIMAQQSVFEEKYC
jgi:hypothetical protein